VTALTREITAVSSSSVATRLPPEFRLAPADVVTLLEQEVFARIVVHDLPAGDRTPRSAQRRTTQSRGGRIYDAHIAEVARAVGASVIVTDNRRHFVSALRYDVRVETPAEFVASIRKSK
jgi:predicted nucleic acid-binding protein